MHCFFFKKTRWPVRLFANTIFFDNPTPIYIRFSFHSWSLANMQTWRKTSLVTSMSSPILFRTFSRLVMLMSTRWTPNRSLFSWSYFGAQVQWPKINGDPKVISPLWEKWKPYFWMVVPPNSTPKSSFLVRKTNGVVGETHHFRKETPFIEEVLTPCIARLRPPT